jgi:hypothetical protein
MEVFIMPKKDEGGAGQRIRGYSPIRYTPIPDELFDDYLAGLSGAEVKVLLYIMRKTFGWKKDSDNISLSQIMGGVIRKDGEVQDRGTGLARDSVTRALKGLEEKGHIIAIRRRSVERGFEATTYTINIVNSQSENPTSPSRKIGLGLVEKSDIQQTDLQETEKQHGVVVREALRKFGITANVANRLTTTYPEAYLLAKLDLVQWLVDSHSALVGKNPAGYLRRAIEEDYAAPPTYRSPEQRSAAEREREVEREAAYEQRRDAEAEYAREKAVAQQQLRERYPPTPIPGTDLTTAVAWEQTLDRLHGQLSRLNYETWLANTALIGLADGTARIVAASRFQAEHLTQRLQPLVAQALSDVVGHPAACHFISLPELLDAEADPLGPATPAAVIDPQGEESRRSRPHDTADQTVRAGP